MVLYFGISIVCWVICGFFSANRAEKSGRLNPLPEIGGIGYCAYVIMGPLGLIMNR